MALFGPPLIFVTPNIADTKQPLLLIVQGEEFILGADVTASYREMTQRVARDPVGQAIVFELLIRLFFPKACCRDLRERENLYPPIILSPMAATSAR